MIVSPTRADLALLLHQTTLDHVCQTDIYILSRIYVSSLETFAGGLCYSLGDKEFFKMFFKFFKTVPQLSNLDFAVRKMDYVLSNYSYIHTHLCMYVCIYTHTHSYKIRYSFKQFSSEE